MLDRRARRGARLNRLTETGPRSLMGRLLRRFWHPIAVGRTLATGSAQHVRVLGEDLTLYRGASGRPYLVGARCAHRLTLLATGWVEGEAVRCMYHGWTYDGEGRCVERPAERDDRPCDVRIAAYPAREYGGLIFAYLGPDEPPPFELPRKPAFEDPDRILYARSERWNTNWLQMVENSMDAVHVSFVHQKGRSGNFIRVVSEAIPELSYEETGAGIRQVATRGNGNVRISDWTFPNANHIAVPGLEESDAWIDVGHWNVPIDDEHTYRMNIWSTPKQSPGVEARVRAYFASVGEYDPSASHDELMVEGKYPADRLLALTSAQDYVAQRGQGVIADREHELLGRSDAGIALLRRIYLRELDRLERGEPPKEWRGRVAGTR